MGEGAAVPRVARSARPSPAWLPALAVFALAALHASPSAAGDCDGALSTCIDADNLWVHPGPTPWLALGGASTTPEDRMSFGLVVSYLSRPIGVRVASPDPEGTVIYAVDNAVDATFLWSLGITDRLELTVAAPVTVWQDGAGLADVVGSDEELPRSSVRDTRLGLAFAVLPRPRAGSADGFALASRFEFTLPVADARAFAGSRTATFVPSLAADLRLGGLLFAGELGARIRGESELGGARVGSQLMAGAGASYEVLPKELLRVGAEAFALYTFASQQPPMTERDEFDAGPALVPAEWIASARTAPLLGGDVSLSLAGGGPIPFADSSAITTPRFRFDLAIRYAPTGADGDADGVLDRDDRCPAQAEDRDGFQDEDGCPDPDNDGDRIPDARDRCRDAPETVDGFKDDDGCPDADDDGDGIPDASDRCRNAAEDKDGYADDDGCPEPDNDGDGILDAADQCPTGAEDKDGFKDEDGCPDPDNDLDQTADADDRCPDAAEDRDGFQDQDGCPDPDNDEDGVLDGNDACPAAAETIDGTADADGCPEPGARPRVGWSGERVTIEGLSSFAAGSTSPPKPLAAQIAMSAQLIRGRAPLETIIVEAQPDRPGDASPRALELAAARAEAVKALLVAGGIPADVITAAAGAAGAGARPPAVEITVRRKAAARPRAPAQGPAPSAVRLGGRSSPGADRVRGGSSPGADRVRGGSSQEGKR